MVLCAIIIFIFLSNQWWVKTTILKISPFRIPLLAWAESTVAEFSSDVFFIEVSRSVHVPGPKRLGRTIFRRGPNPSWAEPSRTPYLESRPNLILLLLSINMTFVHQTCTMHAHCTMHTELWKHINYYTWCA